jgi:hypothetical protein
MSVILEHIRQHKSNHIAVADEQRALSYPELFIEINQLGRRLTTHLFRQTRSGFSKRK